MAKTLGTVEVFLQTEQEILKNIAKALRGGKIGTRDWQIEKLNDLGALTKKNAKIIASRAGMSIEAVNEEIRAAGYNAIGETEQLYIKAKKAGASLLDALPLNADPALVEMVKVWQDSATKAINLTNQTLLEGQAAIYRRTIEQTVFEVLTGVSTPEKALARAVRTWSKVGIPSIKDSAGRTYSTEAYVNLVMRSNIRRVTTGMQMERAKSYGSDLVEISSHLDAREGCSPYQGKVYSLSGRSKIYPSLSSTSYGEPAGLFGINCRHQMYPYFPGISSPAGKGFPDSKVEASYKNSQKQREFERAIRQSKRELAIFEALGDTESAAMARATLNNRRAGLRKFLKDSGRTRRSTRELIYNV